MDTYKNFAKATVDTGFAAGATSITLVTGHGANLPAGPANFVVWNSTDHADPSDDPDKEIFRGTVSSDTITVSARAQEGTADVNHNTGGKTYKIIAPLTAKVFNTELSASASPTFVGVTLTGLTAGRVPYVGASDELADSANLLWGNSAQQLTIGSASLANPPDETSLFITKDYATQTANNMTEQFRSYLQSVGGGDINEGRIAISAWVKDHPTNTTNRTITGAANNGSGLIRITTSASHGYVTGDRINIYGVVGTTEANAIWTITAIAGTTFDLQGSTFTNAYVSGGTATNRSQLVAHRSVVQPVLDRGGTSNIGDDVNAYTGSNAGPGKATDGIWITDELSSGPAWNTILSSDSNSEYFLRYTGKVYTAGIDLASATLDSTEPMILLGAGHNIQLDTATGTKIGTATSQKLGFFNATPIVQPSSTTDLRAALINLGLYATGGASPLDLNGGLLTAARAVISTGTITSSTPGLDLAQTWNSGGTEFIGAKWNYTDTASNATSKLFDFQINAQSLFNAAKNGILLWSPLDANSSTVNLFSHSGGTGGSPAAANTTITTLTSYVSAGTIATPLRTQVGQVVLRNGAGGYFAANDGDTATLQSTHRAAIDWVTTEDWTTSAQGMFLRFRTSAAGGTTTNAKAFINEYGLELSTGGSTPTARGTTNPTNAINIFDGTAPAGTLTNGASLYSQSGRLRTMRSDGSARDFVTGPTGSAVLSKSITIEGPTAAEDVSLFFTDDAITITKMVAVLTGSASPSVTWTIRHDTDRNATGTQVVTGGTTTTSTTTGSVVTSFNDATVVADAFLWLETTAQSGTVVSMHVTIYYTVD